MQSDIQSLWNDENFIVRSGRIPGQYKLSGADLGPGILYYPVNVNLHHHVVGALEPPQESGSSFGKLNVLWNTGPESEIFNPSQSASPFIHVGLKPSPQLTTEIPQKYLGLASAALLQDDWDQQFKDSVRGDLDVIQGFIEPLRSGHTPTPEGRERAVLAKQDLDLKLLWSAREYKNRGLLTGTGVARLAAATPATGLINVTVNTRDGSNTAVNGWLVRYVSRIKHGQPAFYKSFSAFSTPTSEHMAVGNYDMWAEKSGTTGPTRTISIVSISNSQSVDLLVP